MPLSVYDFGRELIESKDLDPVYVILHEAQLDVRELCVWLLPYFCFYHVGTASWISDQKYGDTQYWRRMQQAAGSSDYPRSSERRHFRGEAALKSVAWLKKRGVLSLFQPLLGRRDIKAVEVIEYVKTWYLFGDWIAFKVADILERLGLASVKFSLDTVLYDSPRKGAETLWANEMDEEHMPAEVGEWAVNRILSELGGLQAPPRYERPINAQEAETILCKWKSYMNGHYHVGEDIEATRKGLMRFARCGMSQRLLAAGKKGKLWK